MLQRMKHFSATFVLANSESVSFPQQQCNVLGIKRGRFRAARQWSYIYFTYVWHFFKCHKFFSNISATKAIRK